MAVKHLHDKKIVHRNLTPRNVLFMSDGTIKLGGLSRSSVFNTILAKTELKSAVDPHYVPPEAFKGLKHGFSSDMWQLGILLYEMVTLEKPFNTYDLINISVKIDCEGYRPIPPHFHKYVSSLLAVLLQDHPSRRPTITELFEMKPLKKLSRQLEKAYLET